MLHLKDEELLADESFINYCLGLNEADITLWSNIILSHPEEAARLDELRTLVLLTRRGIHSLELKNQIAELGRRIDQSEEQSIITNEAVPVKRSGRWRLIAGAASVIFLLGLAVFYFSQKNTHPNSTPLLYTTQLAEKKSFVLPDGSKVILNAGSKISVDQNFGQEDRRLQLDGEAFFDVAHNAAKPFIVQTSRMDVKVLGTAFNVRDYAVDESSETSLIRGSVELSLKNENKKITLSPNEKYILRENVVEAGNTANAVSSTVSEPASGLMPVRVNKEDTAIVEVSWTEDKLVFVDKPFEELAKQLERWYGVKIEITNPSLKNTLFTASFRNEGLEDVLEALRFTKSFNFERKDNTIMIYK